MTSLAAPATAGVLTFTDRDAWRNALNGKATTLIDFNGFPPNTPASKQYASQGIIFKPDQGVLPIISRDGGAFDTLDTAVGGQTIKWKFTGTVFAVGWDRTSGDDSYEYKIFDTSANLIGQLNLDIPTDLGGLPFGGFISDIPIGSASNFSPNGDQRASIDNIEFTPVSESVPEPEISSALIATGLLSLIRFKARRRKA
ncbi:MAG TPA: hypothetical protein V6C78_14460 [Crinalium sp.]